MNDGKVRSRGKLIAFAIVAVLVIVALLVTFLVLIPQKQKQEETLAAMAKLSDDIFVGMQYHFMCNGQMADLDSSQWVWLKGLC
jgi:preprotein translocase subunit YajC